MIDVTADHSEPAAAINAPKADALRNVLCVPASIPCVYLILMSLRHMPSAAFARHYQCLVAVVITCIQYS